MPGSHSNLLFAIASVVVAASIIAGVVVVGTPSAQRRQRLDALRIEDLQRLQQLVLSYTSLHRRLPESLEVLAQEPGYAPSRNDPESGAPYIYEPLSRDTFRVCAAFATSSNNEQEINSKLDRGTWAHRVGKQCFDRHADVAGVSP
jgi:hypothetical protein